jgi:hypothetical protein
VGSQSSDGLTALYSEKTTSHTALEDFEAAATNSGGSIVLGDPASLFEDWKRRQAIVSCAMWPKPVLDS